MKLQPSDAETTSQAKPSWFVWDRGDGGAL